MSVGTVNIGTTSVGTVNKSYAYTVENTVKPEVNETALSFGTDLPCTLSAVSREIRSWHQPISEI
jgi:hypothetical protein